MAGLKAKLTKRIADDLVAARELWVWDDKLPGFGLRVEPSGVKTYIVQYRNALRRPREITLGRHGVLTPEEAHRMARQTLAAIARGEGPAEDRQVRRNATTVADLCDRYLAEHVEVRNKPSTRRQMRRMAAVTMKPVLGGRSVESVTRSEIVALHGRLRSTPYEANRVLASLGKMFNLAELWGLRPDGSNPCRHVERNKEMKRERFLLDAEPARLGEALAEIERERPEFRPAAQIIRMLAFTGCRCGEIVDLHWEDLDLAERVIRLRDAKAGPRTVPLAAPALALLASMREAAAKGPVWIDDRTGCSRTYWQGSSLWRLVRQRARLDGARIHDLRHTVGTYAGQAGLNAFTVRDLLGHKTLAMTGRYVSRHTEPLRAAADQVVNRIAAALTGGASPKDNVVSLPTAAAR